MPVVGTAIRLLNEDPVDSCYVHPSDGPPEELQTKLYTVDVTTKSGLPQLDIYGKWVFSHNT